jgi:hypothetical protein
MILMTVGSRSQPTPGLPNPVLIASGSGPEFILGQREARTPYGTNEEPSRNDCPTTFKLRHSHNAISLPQSGSRLRSNPST